MSYHIYRVALPIVGDGNGEIIWNVNARLHHWIFQPPCEIATYATASQGTSAVIGAQEVP